MLAPWIENIGIDEVRKGYHYDPGVNSMLIQIVDPGTEFPTPKHEFRQVHKFFFLDVEDNEPDGTLYSCAITNEDAKVMHQMMWSAGLLIFLKLNLLTEKKM